MGASSMPGTTVHCCFTQELEEVANRLLPPEIFAEIGTVGTTTSAGTCCSSSHAVIDGLAMHLNSILGLTDMKAEHQPPRATMAVLSNQHVRRSNNGGMPGLGGNGIAAANMTFVVPLRADAYNPMPVREHDEIGAGEFRPMRRQNGSGTGVFFPRAAELCHTRSSRNLPATMARNHHG